MSGTIFGTKIGSKCGDYFYRCDGRGMIRRVYHPRVEINGKLTLLKDNCANQKTESGLVEFDSRVKAREFAQSFLLGHRELKNQERSTQHE